MQFTHALLGKIAYSGQNMVESLVVGGSHYDPVENECHNFQQLFGEKVWERERERERQRQRKRERERERERKREKGKEKRERERGLSKYFITHSHPYQLCLFFFGGGLWHINLYRLFTSKPIFIQIVLFQSNQFRMSIVFFFLHTIKCQNSSISNNSV